MLVYIVIRKLRGLFKSAASMRRLHLQPLAGRFKLCVDTSLLFCITLSIYIFQVVSSLGCRVLAACLLLICICTRCYSLFAFHHAYDFLIVTLVTKYLRRMYSFTLCLNGKSREEWQTKPTQSRRPPPGQQSPHRCLWHCCRCF